MAFEKLKLTPFNFLDFCIVFIVKETLFSIKRKKKTNDSIFNDLSPWKNSNSVVCTDIGVNCLLFKNIITRKDHLCWTLCSLRGCLTGSILKPFSMQLLGSYWLVSQEERPAATQVFPATPSPPMHMELCEIERAFSHTI